MSNKHTFTGADAYRLQHWKYIKKIKEGKGFRYFYSMDELRAFYAGNNKTNQQSGVKDIAKKYTNKAYSFAKKQIDKHQHKEEPSKKEAPVKNETKVEVKPDNRIDATPGTDDKGNKYIAKVEVNGYTRYFYTKDELKAFQDREKYMAEEPEFMKQYKHSDTPYTAEEDAFNVNPYYGYGERYSVNCAECTAIYELRRRGYDVESNGFTGIIDRDYIEYNTEARYDIMFENPKIQECKPTFRAKSTYKELYSQIDKNPPGSRGDISIQWKSGGGHSMVWEKDLNGNIKIIDTQCSGSGYHTEYSLERLAKVCNNSSGSARIVRTDNLKLKPGIQKIFQNPDEEYRSLRKPQGTYTVDKNGNESLDSLTPANRSTQYPVIGNKGVDMSKKVSRIKALAANGKTYAEIAKILGISMSTISKYL